jgi:AraC-like DNA-binding protein
MRITEWKEVAEVEGELRQYRDRTVALLRKYFLMSVELGHLPSLFGREFFRTRVSSYRTHTFEDTVIFVHDMERALEKLSLDAQDIIARLVFQDFSCHEAASLLGMSSRHLRRRFAEILDSCTRVLLDRGLMERTHESISAMQAKMLSRSDESPVEVTPRTSRAVHRALFPKYCQVGRDGRLKLYC